MLMSELQEQNLLWISAAALVKLQV